MFAYARLWLLEPPLLCIITLLPPSSDRGKPAGCAQSPHRAVPLADAVLPHDVENPQADGVAVTAAAGQTRQRQPRKPPARRVLGAPRLQPDAALGS